MAPIGFHHGQLSARGCCRRQGAAAAGALPSQPVVTLVPQRQPSSSCRRPVRARMAVAAAAAAADDGGGSSSAPSTSGRGGGGEGGEGQQRQRFRSSWTAKEATGGRGGGADYLFELGQSDYNTNVDAGQNVAMIDSLFAGKTLGHKTDIADGSLRREWEFRTYNNIQGEYYIAPAFLNRVAMFVAKNYLADMGAIPPSVRVPLILGVWGPKGCGKTFQTELVFRKLGMEVVVMSAGELESEVAGQPGRMIRERYRKAAELSKVRGKLSALLINDLDAGIGRFANTQVTVNNQIVQGTLMNICDHPNQVSVHETWREGDRIQRVPIIVTGNDLSTVYAPLVRDGRMEKFYWSPTLDDVISIVHQMYKDDGLAVDDVRALVEAFRGQTLDFFGAVRASTYDDQIRRWMQQVSGHGSFAADAASFKEVQRRLIAREGLPAFEPVPVKLDDLLAEGRRLVREQDNVNAHKLSEDYMRGVRASKGRKWGGGIGLMG